LPCQVGFALQGAREESRHLPQGSDSGVRRLEKSHAMNDETLRALTYDLAARLRADTPDWTDDPQDDPGVTLLELFAFPAERLVYRSDPISERERRALARLLTALEPLWAHGGAQPIDGLTRVKFAVGQVLTADD